MNEELLRSVQLTELSILREFKAICEQNNLRYFLCGGTRLGAVRHNGFIPWDDDVDVFMPYVDYISFLDIADKTLDREKYFVQNYLTEDNFPSPFTKIRLVHTTFLDSNYKNWHIHHGIWLDIFPLINISKKKLRKTNVLLKAAKMMQMDDLIRSNPKVFTELYGERMLGRLNLFYKLVPIRSRKKIHDLIIRHICKEKYTGYCVELTGNLKHIYPAKIFDTSKELEFENELFTVPEDYDTYLKVCFGDYMKLPPVEQRVSVHADIIDLEKGYGE